MLIQVLRKDFAVRFFHRSEPDRCQNIHADFSKNRNIFQRNIQCKNKQWRNPESSHTGCKFIPGCPSRQYSNQSYRYIHPAVIFASVWGFPIKTAGKRRNTEIITAPAVSLKTCRIAAAGKMPVWQLLLHTWSIQINNFSQMLSV